MAYVIKGRPWGTPATNDEYETCDIPVREGRVEHFLLNYIEERIECDEQGRQRRVIVIHLHKRHEKKILQILQSDGKENNNT